MVTNVDGAILTILTNVIAPIIIAIISSGWFANRVSKRWNTKDIVNKLNELDYKIDKNQAETYRTRVLRFNGEIKRGIHHDEEEFNDCLEAIDGYEKFCDDHDNYQNSKAVFAIENVKKTYKKAYENNDF